MKKIKLLSISNSFGVNLQTYASQIAKENDLDLDIYVLYIGGCSLERHAMNIKSGEKAYELFHNGTSTKQFVSVLDGLKLMEWDYVITQQVSTYSGVVNTFYPFVDEVYQYVKENAKFKTFGFQETWEYGETDGWFIDMKNTFANIYENSFETMYKNIHHSYEEMSKRFDTKFIVNSGDLIHNAKKEFKDKLYSPDGLHIGEMGCYIVGANLVKMLLDKNLSTTNVFVASDATISKEEFIKAINFVNESKGFEF